MKKNLDISERISYIIDNQFGRNKKRFAESIGYSAQVVSNIVSGRKSKPSYDVLKAIISTNDDISSEWLLTGKGSMLKAAGTDLSPPDGSSGPVQQLQEENNRLKEKIGLQQEIIELLKDNLAMHEEKYKEKQEKKAG